MNLAALDALDAALITVATQCDVLNLVGTAEAIATLRKAAGECRIALVERIVVWLDDNGGDPNAPALMAAARAMVTSIRYSTDIATAAQLRRDGRLQ